MALYHTYRPQLFSEVLGQDIITSTISNQIILGRTAHAYLFSGPRGVGKTTTARIIAKSLSCKERKTDTAEPCNTCVACTSITEGSAIDIIEIDAASNTGVDHVREVIIESANTRPTSLPYKIFIIDEVHMLSKSAFNALLKTLEEPPKHVIFILATTEPEKLPDTIISRCQHFHFRNIPDDILKVHVASLAKNEGVSIDETIIDRIVRKSGGCGRDAVRYLDQLLGIGKKTITVEDANTLFPIAADEWVVSYIEALIAKNPQQAIQQIVQAQEQGQHITALMERTLEVLRAILVYSTTKTAPYGEQISESTLSQLSTTSSTTTILSLFDIVTKRQRQIDVLPLPSYALELVVYEWLSTENTSNEILPATKEPTKTTTPKQTAVAEKQVLQKTEEEITKSEISLGEPQVATSEEIPVKKDTATLFTKEQVQAVWKPFLTYIENNSPSLVFILHMTNIIDVEGDTITISVPYSFHKDKLKELKAYTLITTSLATLLSIPHLSLDIIVTTEETPRTVAPEGLQDLAAAFGGQVVSA